MRFTFLSDGKTFFFCARLAEFIEPFFACMPLFNERNFPLRKRNFVSFFRMLFLKAGVGWYDWQRGVKLWRDLDGEMVFVWLQLKLKLFVSFLKGFFERFSQILRKKSNFLGYKHCWVGVFTAGEEKWGVELFRNLYEEVRPPPPLDVFLLPYKLQTFLLHPPKKTPFVPLI
jgi:hypothetical protein